MKSILPESFQKGMQPNDISIYHGETLPDFGFTEL